MKTLERTKLILFLLIIIPMFTYSQGWQWAKGIGGYNTDRIDGIISDDNIYVWGTFESPDCYFATDTFQLRGDEDIFFAKYNNSGTEQWVKQIGSNYHLGTEHEKMGGITTDPNNGDVYVAGLFFLNISMDSIYLTGLQHEIFIAKYNNNGKLIWAKSFGGAGDDGAGSITIDSIGNLYLNSYCHDTAVFGNYTVPPGDILTKFDTAGNCIWAKLIMNNGAGQIKYNNNSIILAGYTTSNADTLFIDSLKLPVNGLEDIVVAKFDTSGKLIWVNKEGGDSFEICITFCVDSLNNIYITGQVGINTIIGNDTLNTNDLYLAKYNESGTFQWVKEFGSLNHSALVYGISADQQNNVYMAGFLHGAVTFDNFTLTPQSVFDAYLAKYSPNGTCIGVDQIQLAEAFGMTVNSDNKPVICGIYFNQINTSSGTISSHGGDDGCIVMHDAITSINETERKKGNELLIYSNPTTGKCNITIPDEWSNGNHDLTLNLYDGNGSIIQSYPVSVKDGVIKLDIEKEAKGIYIVSLTDGKKVYNGKVVFQ